MTLADMEGSHLEGMYVASIVQPLTDIDLVDEEVPESATTKTMTTYSSTAGAKVIKIYELSEAILEYSTPRELLRLQRVCLQWKGIIAQSSRLRKKLVIISPVKYPSPGDPPCFPLCPNLVTDGWCMESGLRKIDIDIADFWPTDLSHSWAGM